MWSRGNQGNKTCHRLQLQSKAGSALPHEKIVALGDTTRQVFLFERQGRCSSLDELYSKPINRGQNRRCLGSYGHDVCIKKSLNLFQYSVIVRLGYRDKKSVLIPIQWKAP